MTGDFVFHHLAGRVYVVNRDGRTVAEYDSLTQARRYVADVSRWRMLCHDIERAWSERRTQLRRVA